jgi:tetratricopeptide (TPR) repeat protein
MAGDRAENLDPAKAESYYRRALELLPLGEAGRRRVWVGLFWAASRAAGTGVELAVAEAAVAESREVGDRLAEGASLIMLSRVRYWQGDRAAAEAISDQARSLLEAEPPGPELVGAYVYHTGGLMMAERSRECIEWANRTIELADRLDVPLDRYRALGFRGLSRQNIGDAGGVEDVREGLRGMREFGTSAQVASGMLNLGDMVWINEGPSEGLRHHRETIDFAERRGMIPSAMWARAETTWMLHELGRWDEQVRIAEEVRAWDRDRTQISLLAEPWKALVHLYRGDLATAASIVDLLDRARAAGDPQVVIPTLTAAAMVELDRGDAPAAVTLIRERVAMIGQREGSYAVGHTETARVLVAAGELELLEELRRQDDFPIRRTQLSQRASAGLLAEARGRAEDAVGSYLEASEGWSAFGNPFETALAELGAGRCLLELGRPEEASGHLHTARATFVRLGAVGPTSEADELLAIATAKSS